MHRVAVVMMSLSMVVVAMGRRRRSQTHLFRPKFPVQPRALSSLAAAPRSVDPPPSRSTQPAEFASMLTTLSEVVKPLLGYRCIATQLVDAAPEIDDHIERELREASGERRPAANTPRGANSSRPGFRPTVVFNS